MKRFRWAMNVIAAIQVANSMVALTLVATSPTPAYWALFAVAALGAAYCVWQRVELGRRQRVE